MKLREKCLSGMTKYHNVTFLCFLLEKNSNSFDLKQINKQTDKQTNKRECTKLIVNDT